MQGFRYKRKSRYIWHFLMFVCFLCKKSPESYGQVHNGEIYQQLIGTYFSDHKHFKQIQGQPVADWMPEYKIDSLATSQLIMSPAVIKYERLNKSTYVRNISIRLTLQDSTVQSTNQTYSDTLELKSFKQIYKSSPYELRGDAPFPIKKWGLPVVLIGGSIVGVLTLFFVRSR